MKLTEPPLATASIRISLSAAWTCGEACSGATLISGIGLTPCENDDIATRRAGFVGKGHLGWRTESQAVAGSKQMPLAGFNDDEGAGAYPHRLTNMRVGPGREPD